ncbi:hypothetical protein AM305_07753 [Actinobacillus minor NM305]|uniref:Uncharacterized protein n=1 Tax=Actinobacillus minor NM305 TaxID=637911 RepID=C5S0X5_9PAST|nr:hypothetical protein [Actinobacillus minor]EER47558.1 hypothetical protein AM305_07753 [Actinobacillus minor NM305]
MADWIYIDEQKPEQSGKYLVVASVKEFQYKKTTLKYVFLNEWDNNAKSFTYDKQIAKRGRLKAEERIYAWLPYKQPPLPKSKQ